MMNITVRSSIKTETEHPKIWEITGIDTPVKYVTVGFLPVEQNSLLVSVHEDAIKMLRLKELRAWKKRWKLTSICGYNAKKLEFVTIQLPPSYKNVQLRPFLYWFLRILLDGMHREI